MKQATLFIFLALFILPTTAYAYLDPGSGSYVIQIIIASILGALFFLKSFWQKIKGWFLNTKGRDNKPSSDDKSSSN